MISFLGSFPQTSVHVRARVTTKPSAWHEHTHMQAQKQAQVLGWAPAHCLHNPQAFAMPWFFFYYQLYCSLCTQPSVAQSKSWTLDISWLLNLLWKPLYRNGRKSMVPWVYFTNHPLFAFHWVCLLLKEKKRKSLCHHAYLQIWMHSNSYPELPKLRITQFWIRGERKIIHEKPL